MSRISDVSSKLGEYMLKGYILTDDGCPVCSIPMLRTPSGQSPPRLFCSQCHPNLNDPPPSALTKQVSCLSSTSSRSSEKISRVSTPPTEVSSALSSPTFALPPDSEETLRRRAQSDMASSEIGKRMLRGWAMLAEECPNESCYGVPLVRPPKPGGGKDPRKECVVCGQVYIFEQNAHGLDALVPLQGTEAVTEFLPPRTAPHINTTPISISTNGAPGMTNENPALPQQEFGVRSLPIQSSMPLQTPGLFSTMPILDKSIQSLEQSLHVLSTRLASITNQPPLDHVKLGEVAHTMEQVSSALGSLKQLRLQEISRYV
ncbi:hypothetical protein K439DRAFT_1326774 [Ramaria rubella]|nr:hypothetical protein K439DRAFT_1326774 [Ramaria rubella]